MKDIFLLDLDETLLDFRRAERENLLWALRENGIEGDDRVYARFHAVNDALWKALERGEIERSVIKTERFVRLFSEFGFSADPHRAASAYFDHFPAVCYPFPGAEAFLAVLHGRGRCYLVTNGSAPIQRAHVERAGFLPYLEDVFISEELGANKPSRAFAEAVMQAIPGFARERTVWIGDSLTSDMVCAERMGVDFILFGTSEEYDGRKASDYFELLSLIDGM